MIARINAKTEKALREAIGSVPRAGAEQIAVPLAVLDERERAEALGLAITVACYVAVDVCGSQWPNQANLRQIAEDLATTSTTAERLHLDAGEIYAYLSRTVLRPERLEDVIPDEPQFTRLPVSQGGVLKQPARRDHPYQLVPVEPLPAERTAS